MEKYCERHFEAGSLTKEQFVEMLEQDFTAAKKIYDALERTRVRRAWREARQKAHDEIKDELVKKYKRQSTRDKYAMPMLEKQDLSDTQESFIHDSRVSYMNEEGKPQFVITQNIDGLHQKAGSRKVCEIHGSALRSYCVSCNTQYGPDFIFESRDDVPGCPNCGKMVRPDVTLYGEFLPQNAYEEAVSLIRYADCLIIGGTSLEVGSAAQLAHMYHGKYLVIINKGKTKMEGRADLVFHESIGEVLKKWN